MKIYWEDSAYRSTRSGVENGENNFAKFGEPNSRITRARAKILASKGLPPLHPSTKQDGRRDLQANLKRAAPGCIKAEDSSAASPPHKKRAVLKDVTNVTCETLYTSCIGATKVQGRKASIRKNKEVKGVCSVKQSPVPKRGNVMVERNKVKIGEPKETSQRVYLTVGASQCMSGEMSVPAVLVPCNINSERNVPPTRSSSRGFVENQKPWKKSENLEDKGIADLDSENNDPLMCSLYAADIYTSLHASQFDRRPLADYMKNVQRDITNGMRGILIDWLVEVSEEYKLFSDTLYLTVNLIDRFLSQNYVEKGKLQLVGVTCMLIASKYEEIYAPRVEEFCVITDNTYTKEEVVGMESRVLNCLNFQLSVPTTKMFLRRFIQAAQGSYKNSSDELELLANYLAELTLCEYSFIKFLPSLIAASVVFLARWTINQSEHPWNPALEYYTRHNTSELKCAVLQLQDLQLNTKECKLNAIREKYKQPKFQCVSTLRPVKPVQILFEASDGSSY